MVIAIALVAGRVGVVLGVTLGGGRGGPSKAIFVGRAGAICKTARWRRNR